MTNCICGMWLGEFGYGMSVVLATLIGLYIGSKIRRKE